METRVAIVREAETAVELHRPVGGMAVGTVSGGLCHPHSNFAKALIAEAVGGAIQMRACFFISDISVDHRVLQRLIFADNLAELFAGAQIIERVVDDGLRAAAHFGALKERGGDVDMRQCRQCPLRVE